MPLYFSMFIAQRGAEKMQPVTQGKKEYSTQNSGDNFGRKLRPPVWRNELSKDPHSSNLRRLFWPQCETRQVLARLKSGMIVEPIKNVASGRSAEPSRKFIWVSVAW
jgi:hypothetical protein